MKKSYIILVGIIALIAISFLPTSIELKVDLETHRLYRTTTLVNGGVITTCKTYGKRIYSDISIPFLGIYFSY